MLPPVSVESVLIICICLQGGISLINSVKSYQMSVFKIDRIMAFINSVIPLLPIINYTTMLISYNDDNSQMLPFFIEWSVAVPLLLINVCKFLNFSIIQYSIPCILSIIMTLTGYASATAQDDTSMFALFAVAGTCYVSILLFMFINYYKQLDKVKHETNCPSSLTQNQLNIFRTLFYTIAIIWNGYPILFIMWKTHNMSMENTVICFAGLDLITKGLCILIMLSYKMMLYKQNGFLVKAFRKLIKVQPIEDISHNTVQSLI